LRGFSNADIAEAAISNHLVDIAYVDNVSPNEILIVLDAGVPFDQPKDFEWLKTVLAEVLADAGQKGVTVEPA
jgi:hypothetical protein